MAKITPPRSIETKFAKQLKKVASQVSKIIDAFIVGGLIENTSGLNDALNVYSKQLDPWANSVSIKIISLINASNKRSWSSHVSLMSADLKRSLKNTTIGAVAKQLQDDQVTLIKSLPIEASTQAQALARDAINTGERASETAKKVLQLGNITKNRAVLIARTETAKANTALTAARSHSVGATHYIWRTVSDADVRDTHAALEGTVHAFSAPPQIPGEGAHAPGDFPNCRCWAEPII